MRRHALTLAVLFVAVILFTAFFLLDPILDWSLENAMETITGAQVDIDRFHLDIPTLTVSVGRLQVANPRNTWRNILETGEFSVILAAEPLFSGKVVIESIVIDALAIDTPRKTDGKLKRKLLPGPFGKAQSQLHRNIAAMPILDLNRLKEDFHPDRLIDSAKLNLDTAADNIREDITATGKRWQAAVAELEQTQEKIEHLKESIRALRTSKSKNIIEIRQAIEELKAVKKEYKAIEDHLSDTGSRFKKEFHTLSEAIDNLKAIADGDFKTLMKLANLPDFESFNIAEALFGKALLDLSSPVVSLMDELQAYFPPTANQTAKAKPPRGGIDISFPGRRTYPRFLIKEIQVSGRGTAAIGLDGYRASGRIQGITSEPLLYGRPLEIALTGHSPQEATLQFQGSVDQASTEMNGTFQLSLANLSLPSFELPDNPYLPEKVNSGKVRIDTGLTFAKNGFHLRTVLEGYDLVGDNEGKPEPSDIGMEIIREVLSRVDRLAIEYYLESQGQSLSMKIGSNLDQIIKQRFKEVVGEKIAAATLQLRQKIENRLSQRQAELKAYRSKYQQAYEEKLNVLQTKLRQEQAKLDEERKALEEKLQSGLSTEILKKIKF